MRQFALVAGKTGYGFVLLLASQRQNIGGGDPQVSGDGDFADGDRQIVQLGVVNVATHENFGEGASNNFADF